VYSLLIASSRDYVIPTVQSMANFLGGVYDFHGGGSGFPLEGYGHFPLVGSFSTGGGLGL